MTVFEKISLSGLAVVIVTTSAMAQSANEKSIREYEISMAKVVQYDAAVRDLEAATQKDAALKAERQKMAREFARTPVALTDRLERHPRIMVFFKAKGLTSDNAVLIPVVLSNACHAEETPQLAKVLIYSETQLRFCRDNRGDLHKLRIFVPVAPGITPK